MADNRTPGRYTLADFVEDNHKLLTVFGVFVAVAAFANNLPLNYIGKPLSFFAVLAAVSLGIELFRKYIRAVERGFPTMTLWLFFFALLACIVWVCYYWLLGYPGFSGLLMIGLLPVAFIISVLRVVTTRYPHLFKDRVFWIWFILFCAVLTFITAELAPTVAQWQASIADTLRNLTQ